MTKEEMTAMLTEIHAAADALALAYNDAMFSSNIDEATRVNAEIEKKIGEYAEQARLLVFCDCKDAEDPMMEAVKRLTYQVLSVKDEPVEGSDMTRRIIVLKDKQIDLLKLHKFCNGIGADHNWPYMIEKFNMLLTARKAEELGIDPQSINDSYAMSEIARDFDLGRNPASKTKILDTLRNIVCAMIGEEYMPNVNSHDVAFLLSIYSKKSRKALTVSCANHKYMRGYVMEICHRVATGKTYDVEYKTK